MLTVNIKKMKVNIMDSLGQKIFHHSLSLGYAETKKELAKLDECGIVCYEDFDKQYQILIEIAKYYEREYESYLPEVDENMDFWQKMVYCVLKSLLHLQPISPVDNIAEKAAMQSTEILYELKYANEYYCWNVFFQMYVVFIEQLISRRRAYPRCCTDHFIGVKQSFIDVLYNSRNRLSDITPSYIRLVNDILLQKHENISADRIRILLNKSGFITFIKYWTKQQNQISLFFCDIDKFKQVNDCNDHTIGDGVLNDIATVLVSVSKQNDGIAARIGGEEFWIALCDSKAGLTAVFEEIKTGLMDVERPNPDEKCLKDGVYNSYMTMTSAGGVLPILEDSDDESISEWMYNLENKWMDRLDKVVVASKNRNRRNRFYEVDLC